MHQRSLHHSRISPCGRYAIPSHLLLPFSLLYGECGILLLRLDWILATTRDFRKEAALKSATNLWLLFLHDPSVFLCQSLQQWHISNGGGKYHTKNWILNIKESEIFKEIFNALKMSFFLLISLPLFWGFVSLFMLINAKIMFLWYSVSYFSHFFKNLIFKQNELLKLYWKWVCSSL